MTRRIYGAAVVVALLAAVTGCSDDEEMPIAPARTSTTVATTVTIPSTTTRAPAPVTTVDPTSSTTTTAAPGIDPLDAWALAYTGGTAGPAAGEPIRIGYANQEDLFPEATDGAVAAVTYLNARLGGIEGRPVELVTCRIATADDGGRCGRQFADDGTVALVITGTIVSGNRAFYDALQGVKPVLIGNGVTPDDLTTPVGVAYSIGSIGLIPALAIAATTLLDPRPSTAVILHSDTAARQVAAETLLVPVFTAAGVPTTLVPLADDATVDDVVAALQSVGATDVVIPLVNVQTCINTYDALRALALSPVVVAPSLCQARAMGDHLAAIGAGGPVPDGWYVVGSGYNVFDPDLESGMQTYVRTIGEHAQASGRAVDPSGFAGPVFANVLTAARILGDVGVDTLDVATLDGAVRSFPGPMMLQAGDIACGVPPYIAACGHFAGVHQYSDGAWVAIADGTNGRAIDVRAG